MRASTLLLCLLVLAACGREADPPARGTAPTRERARAPAPRGADLEPRPAPIVFDTLEPSAPPVEIPQRPPPPPAPPPLPLPEPPATAPGSCDVRASESFCFAYTGSGWTAEDAADQCSEAPSSRYLTGACPTAGQIATCIFRRPSDPTLEVVYTYYAPYDLGLAEVACPGEFSRLGG